MLAYYIYNHLKYLNGITDKDSVISVRFLTRRKAALGSTSEKGLRWTERILSCWQTYRAQRWSSFEFLRNTMGNFLQGVPQDLSIYEALLRRAQEARAKLGLDDMSAPPTA